MSEIAWGPQGKLVYERTYSRTKANGEKETWPETVDRVVRGNLALAPAKHQLPHEYSRLVELMTDFKILPAGRHLWATGVEGRQYLFNCHVSGWDVRLERHFEFTFLRLMEGGGVGANYSNRFLEQYPEIKHAVDVHIVCSPEHRDFNRLVEAGVLSEKYQEQPPLADVSVLDSREGWAKALSFLLETAYVRTENEVIFDISHVRPAGAELKTFGGYASGPLPLAEMLHNVAIVLNERVGEKLTGLDAMLIDHYIAQCVVSGGNRRSARMAIMHWQDPQIFDFIRSKEEGGHWTTNISVEIDDEFWNDLENGAVHAEDVMSRMVEGMMRNGEPGFWNSSLSNEGEPNEVIATNPCGEIALEAWENCNLGHVNLAAFVVGGGWDYVGLAEAHELMTRFLMRATYGDVRDDGQREKLLRNRRIGVGHFGFANAIAKLGIKYSDAPYDSLVSGMLYRMSELVDMTADDYAHALRIPVPVKTRTVAPTGTIAKMPGVSEGIHPIFAKYFTRRIRLSTIDPEDFDKILRYMSEGYVVEEDKYASNTMVVEFPTKDTLLEQVAELYGEARAEEIVQGAHELTLEQMLEVQAMYQACWADNAVSFTANVDPKLSEAAVRKVLLRVGPKLKGATIFPEKGFEQAPYERLSKAEYEASQQKSVGDGVDENCKGLSCPVK